MPIIVVTRLRLRVPSLLDEFFTHAVAVIEQAQKTDGNLGADALAASLLTSSRANTRPSPRSAPVTRATGPPIFTAFILSRPWPRS